MRKLITTLSLLLLATLSISAQEWSYVYIQGDKQIPFYVKLEDEMLPRYSKNFCIIPELEAGPIHIQILFQQNEFPPIRFTILVPESGYRGFLLTRKENDFSLYDLQQKFYLYPGESGEDHLPAIVAMNTDKAKEPEETRLVAPKAKNTKPLREAMASSSKSGNNRAIASGNNHEPEDPRFMNVELTNEHTIQATPLPSSNQPVIEQEPEPAVEEPEVDYRQTEAKINLTTNAAPIANEACPESMGDMDFDKIYTSSLEKKGDDKRIAYLMKKIDGNCFSTRQVYFLARQLNAESMRYSFLKKVYPRVTDQQNFRQLENNLFKTLEWKSYFHLIQ